MNTEDGKLIEQQEQLDISDVIHSISPQILKELYQMGFDDGWNEMSNTEYSHDSEVKGFDKVIEELYKKYCV
jgi:hypothetical protein